MTLGADAILVAAGAGERLGAAEPKAFVELAGEPLVLHALRALLAAETVGSVVVVVGLEHTDRMKRLLEHHGLAAGVAAGGRTRFASVDNGMQSLDRSNHVVAVHDAARPLITPALIDRTVRALTEGWDAAAPAVPVVDTIKQVDGERVERTVDRTRLRAVQTPQVLPRLTLERAHEEPDAMSATDDLVLVERAGGRVRLVDGERENFKVTYPEDLHLAEALLALRGGGAP